MKGVSKNWFAGMKSNEVEPETRTLAFQRFDRDSERVAIRVLDFCNSRHSKWRITPLLATFVLAHLLVQLGYVHASMHAALVLASNRFCSCSV